MSNPNEPDKPAAADSVDIQKRKGSAQPASEEEKPMSAKELDEAQQALRRLTTIASTVVAAGTPKMTSSNSIFLASSPATGSVITNISISSSTGGGSGSNPAKSPCDSAASQNNSFKQQRKSSNSGSVSGSNEDLKLKARPLATISNNVPPPQSSGLPTSASSSSLKRLLVSDISSVDPAAAAAATPQTAKFASYEQEQEFLKNFQSATQSIEQVFRSTMFNKLFNLQQSLSQSNQYQRLEDLNSGGVVMQQQSYPSYSETEEESDDSYAAYFSECIQKVSIYRCDPNDLIDCQASAPFDSGGLFRIVMLTNKTSSSSSRKFKSSRRQNHHHHHSPTTTRADVYVFLLKTKHINLNNLRANLRNNANDPGYVQEVKKVFAEKQPNDIWLWWSDDDKNRVQSNDQILCIDGVYLDRASHVKFAYEFLKEINSSSSRNSCAKASPRSSIVSNAAKISSSIIDHRNQPPATTAQHVVDIGSSFYSRVDILIARNINRELTRYNSKAQNRTNTNKNHLLSLSLSQSSLSLTSSSSSPSPSSLVAKSNRHSKPQAASKLLRDDKGNLELESTKQQQQHESSQSQSSSVASSSSNLSSSSTTTASSSSSTLLLYNLNDDCLRRSYDYAANLDDNTPTTTTAISEQQQQLKKQVSRNQMTFRDMMVLNTEWTQIETIELLNESSSTSNATTVAPPPTSTTATAAPASASSNTTKPTFSTSSSLNASLSGSGGGGSGSGGFGFGITGNKSTGVVVKAITPGGSAHKDGRLRINDQIFQIGDINVRSMSSEQVAAVLRQSSMHGQFVKFIVARPVHNTVGDIDLASSLDATNNVIATSTGGTKLVESPSKSSLAGGSAILSSSCNNNSSQSTILIRTSEIMDKKVNLPARIAAEIEQRSAGAVAVATNSETATNPTESDETKRPEDSAEKKSSSPTQDDSKTPVNKTPAEVRKSSSSSSSSPQPVPPPPPPTQPQPPTDDKRLPSTTSEPPVTPTSAHTTTSTSTKKSSNFVFIDSNTYQVELTRREKLSIASTGQNEPAELSWSKFGNKSSQNDKVKTLLNTFNQQLIEFAILIDAEEVTNSRSPSHTRTTTLTLFIAEKLSSSPSHVKTYDQLLEINALPVDYYLSSTTNTTYHNCETMEETITKPLQALTKLSIKCFRDHQFTFDKIRLKWHSYLQTPSKLNDFTSYANEEEETLDIVVTLIDKTKSKSLGISLEGTVDIDDNGVETCPHHYIRSILKDGPVDLATPHLEPGDELLEIDCKRLYAINYLDLLEILKHLSSTTITLACARKRKRPSPQRRRGANNRDSVSSLKKSAAAVEKSPEASTTPTCGAAGLDLDLSVVAASVPVGSKMTKRAKSEGFLGDPAAASGSHSSETPEDEQPPQLNPTFQQKKLANGAGRHSPPVSTGEGLDAISPAVAGAGGASEPAIVSTSKSTPSISHAVNNQHLGGTVKAAQPLQSKAPRPGRTPPLCVRSRSLELNGLALWNKRVSFISLVKGEKGLGFSLIDYQQDPFNPLSKTMIVIRALVPNGVAQLDGRLMPGQRLVSINDIQLDEDLITNQTQSSQAAISNNSLNLLKSTGSIPRLSMPAPPPDLLQYTVNFLKSLPVGKIVRLGVQKPLPYPDADTTCLPEQEQSFHAVEGKCQDGGAAKSKKAHHKSKPSSRSTHALSYPAAKASATSTSTPSSSAPKKKRKTKIITTSHYDLKQDEVAAVASEEELSTSATSEEVSSMDESSSSHSGSSDGEKKPMTTAEALSKSSKDAAYENKTYESSSATSGSKSSDQQRPHAAFNNNRIKYGFVATSAPAILLNSDFGEVETAGAASGAPKQTTNGGHQTTTAATKKHAFYASSTILKEQCRDIYNQLYNASGSNSKINSTHELVSAAVKPSVSQTFSKSKSMTQEINNLDSATTKSEYFKKAESESRDSTTGAAKSSKKPKEAKKSPSKSQRESPSKTASSSCHQEPAAAAASISPERSARGSPRKSSQQIKSIMKSSNTSLAAAMNKSLSMPLAVSDVDIEAGSAVVAATEVQVQASKKPELSRTRPTPKSPSGGRAPKTGQAKTRRQRDEKEDKTSTAKRIANSSMFLNYLLSISDDNDEIDEYEKETIMFIDKSNEEDDEDDAMAMATSVSALASKVKEANDKRPPLSLKQPSDDKKILPTSDAGQLISEAQFNEAFILNTSKKLINLIESNRLEEEVEPPQALTSQAKVVSTVSAKNDLEAKASSSSRYDDKLDDKSSKRKSSSKSSSKQLINQTDTSPLSLPPPIELDIKSEIKIATEPAVIKSEQPQQQQAPITTARKGFIQSLIKNAAIKQAAAESSPAPTPSTTEPQVTASQENHTTECLNAMIKDMATFKWPKLNATTESPPSKSESPSRTIFDSSSAPTTNSTNSTNTPPQKPTISTAPTVNQIEKIKQLKFDGQSATAATAAAASSEMNDAILSKLSPSLKTTSTNLKATSSSHKAGISKSGYFFHSPSSARSLSGSRGDSESRFRSIPRGIDAIVAASSSALRASTSTMASRSSSRNNSVKIVNILGKDVLKLPSGLEKEIKIKKNFDSLGISSVDCQIDEGVNGCVILKIEPHSACHNDKRLKVGDYLLSVNNEQMRNLTNSSARAILNRASLTCKDVVIIYIPYNEAVKFIRSVNKSFGYSYPIPKYFYPDELLKTTQSALMLSSSSYMISSSTPSSSSCSSYSSSSSLTSSTDSLNSSNAKTTSSSSSASTSSLSSRSRSFSPGQRAAQSNRLGMAASCSCSSSSLDSKSSASDDSDLSTSEREHKLSSLYGKNGKRGSSLTRSTTVGTNKELVNQASSSKAIIKPSSTITINAAAHQSSSTASPKQVYFSPGTDSMEKRKNKSSDSIFVDLATSGSANVLESSKKSSYPHHHQSSQPLASHKKYHKSCENTANRHGGEDASTTTGTDAQQFLIDSSKKQHHSSNSSRKHKSHHSKHSHSHSHHHHRCSKHHSKHRHSSPHSRSHHHRSSHHSHHHHRRHRHHHSSSQHQNRHRHRHHRHHSKGGGRGGGHESQTVPVPSVSLTNIPITNKAALEDPNADFGKLHHKYRHHSSHHHERRHHHSSHKHSHSGSSHHHHHRHHHHKHHQKHHSKDKHHHAGSSKQQHRHGGSNQTTPVKTSSSSSSKPVSVLTTKAGSSSFNNYAEIDIDDSAYLDTDAKQYANIAEIAGVGGGDKIIQSDDRIVSSSPIPRLSSDLDNNDDEEQQEQEEEVLKTNTILATTEIMMSSANMNDLTSSLWGQPRNVILVREPNKSLGISIVGGKLDVCSSTNDQSSGELSSVNSFITGIFIKHVLENSPAGLNGTLKTGDRILAVNDIDLTQATHDKAVEVIRNAKSPVKFLIQSLICTTTSTTTAAASNSTTITSTLSTTSRAPATTPVTPDDASSFNSKLKPSSSASSVIKDAAAEVVKLSPSQSNLSSPTAAAAKPKEKAVEPAAVVSPAPPKLSPPVQFDPTRQVFNEPNPYNYSIDSVLDKYGYLLSNEEQDDENDDPDGVGEAKKKMSGEDIQKSKSKLFIFKLIRVQPQESLGLSLSGNVNLSKTSVFVCGIYSNSIAHRHGLIQVGDQILEINGHSLYGRAHSNVTPLIRNIKDLEVYLVILRNAENFNQMFKPTPTNAGSAMIASESLNSLSKSASPLNASSPVVANSKQFSPIVQAAAPPPVLSNSSSPAVQSPSTSSPKTTTVTFQTPLTTTMSDSNAGQSSGQTTTGTTSPAPPVEEKPKEKPVIPSTLTTSTSVKKSTTTKILKKIRLKKGPSGFGIAISEDRHSRLIVRGLNPNGVAFHDGQMQVGDEIIAVNDVKVNTMKYDDVMHVLHTTVEPVEFTVLRSDRSNRTEQDPGSSTQPSASASNSASANVSGNASGSTSPLPPPQQTKVAKSPPEPSPLPKPVSTSSPVKPTTPTQPKSPLLVSSPVLGDPRVNQIRVGEETLIEIERGKMGLGLSIVGGSDTQLPGIIIHDIYENGAAFKDGRLAIGDQILKVNNTDITNATHEQALNTLRQTSDTVKLLIHRGFYSTHQQQQQQQSAAAGAMHVSMSSNSSISTNDVNSGNNLIEDEKSLNILTVELNKKFAKGLGFSIIGRRDGSGVFISHIIDGGCAHKDGRLMIGDLILEVNGCDIRKSPYNDVAYLLKTLPQGKVALKIGRFKTSSNASNSNSASQSANGSKTTSRRNSMTSSTPTSPPGNNNENDTAAGGKGGTGAVQQQVSFSSELSNDGLPPSKQVSSFKPAPKK